MTMKKCEHDIRQKVSKPSGITLLIVCLTALKHIYSKNLCIIL